MHFRSKFPGYWLHLLPRSCCFFLLFCEFISLMLHQVLLLDQLLNCSVLSTISSSIFSTVSSLSSDILALSNSPGIFPGPQIIIVNPFIEVSIDKQVFFCQTRCLPLLVIKSVIVQCSSTTLMALGQSLVDKSYLYVL